MALAGIEIRCVNAADGTALAPIAHYGFDTNEAKKNPQWINAISQTSSDNKNIHFENTQTLPIIVYKKETDGTDGWAFAVSSDREVVQQVKFKVIYDDNGLVRDNYDRYTHGFTKFFNERCNRPEKQIQHFVAKYKVKINDGTKEIEAYTIVTIYNGTHNNEVEKSSEEFKNLFFKASGLDRFQNQPGS